MSQLIEEEEEDRISKLPDELLSQILTYLDSDVAVQTSVLSKRWFSAGDRFPCIKEVDIDIELRDDDFGGLQEDDEYRMASAMPNFISMLDAVRETPVLKLTSETIQFLRRVPDISEYQPSPICDLKFLYLQGFDEIPDRSTDPVINYLLSNSPCAEILRGHIGRNQKFVRIDHWITDL